MAAQKFIEHDPAGTVVKILAEHTFKLSRGRANGFLAKALGKANHFSPRVITPTAMPLSARSRAAQSQRRSGRGLRGSTDAIFEQCATSGTTKPSSGESTPVSISAPSWELGGRSQVGEIKLHSGSLKDGRLDEARLVFEPEDRLTPEILYDAQ